MSNNHKYPLWCVDRGEQYDEDRYIGPFETWEDAKVKHREESVEEGIISMRLRRCRRAKASEISAGWFLDVGEIVDRANDDPEPQNEHAWGNWDLPVVYTDSHDAAQKEIFEWADKYLVTRVYICEGDE